MFFDLVLLRGEESELRRSLFSIQSSCENKIKSLGRVEIELSLVRSFIQMLRSELSADLESKGKEKKRTSIYPHRGTKGRHRVPDLATSRTKRPSETKGISYERGWARIKPNLTTTSKVVKQTDIIGRWLMNSIQVCIKELLEAPLNESGARSIQLELLIYLPEFENTIEDPS